MWPNLATRRLLVTDLVILSQDPVTRMTLSCHLPLLTSTPKGGRLSFQHMSSAILDQSVNQVLQERRCDTTTAFTQNGAPPHIGLCAKQLLRRHFDVDRIISRHFSTAWPPRTRIIALLTLREKQVGRIDVSAATFDDMVVARCWQQWTTEGRVYRRGGSGRPRNTNDREDRAIRRVATSANNESIQRHLPPSRHPVPSRETIRR
ncbi:hypothetical protein TNCV_4091301 [Trichonephila clavipes]|nr:hypothetical protein TNCV_4091301 [Trichonephila clavipes]